MCKNMVFRKITIVFLSIIISFVLNIEAFSQCTNNVGTISGISSFIGQSTRHSLGDTVFLCWEDRFSIDHNEDYVLSDDTDSSTPPGVGYAWYRAEPTSSGPRLSDIKNDAVYQISGDPNIMVTVDNLNGDADFVNDNSYGGLSFSDRYVGLGNPALVHYAPITVDSRAGKRGYYENGDNSCVSANPNESFPVVYLNPIDISDITYGTGADSLKVRFKVTGGLPEYYAQKGHIVDYTDITVLDKDHPNPKHEEDKVQILTERFSHGEYVTVVVPKYGKYYVTINDGVSCASTNNLIVSKYDSPVFVLDTVSGIQGQEVCVKVSVKGYVDIAEGAGIFRYDPSIASFTRMQEDYEYTYSPYSEPGKITVVWNSESGDTLPDGTVLFRLCFKLVGEVGECTPILLDERSYFVNYSDQDLYPEVQPGLICIEAPPGLYASATRCGETAAGNDGIIHFSVFNGVPPYTYTLNKTGVGAIQTGTVLAPEEITSIYDLSSGSYSIDISDSNGDSYTLTGITLVDPPLEFESLTVTDVPCFPGYCDGEASVKVAKIGGFEDPNYSIKWSNGVYGKDTIKGLCNGTYGVTITDQYGCEVDTFAVLNTPKLVADIEVIDSASCVGVNDGEIRVNISGGTPENDGGYKVTWNSDGDQFQEIGVTSSVYNQASGDVDLIIVDANKCKITEELHIGNKYEMVVESNKTDVSCNGQDDGTASFKVDLIGVTNKDFRLDYPIYPFPPLPTKIGTDSFFIDGLGGGRLIVTLTENNIGCSINDTLYIEEPKGISFFVEQKGNYCCDDTDPLFLPTIDVNITDGDFPIVLDGMGETITLNSPSVHSYDGLVGGSYSILVTDAKMCDTTIYFDIEKAEGCLNIDTIKYDDLGCSASATTDIVVEASSSFGNIVYTWINGNTGAIIAEGTNTLSNMGPGLYVIEVKDNGCTISDTISLMVTAPYTVTADIDSSECAVGEIGGLPGYACVNIDGGNAGYTFLWEDGNTNNCRELAAGSYLVTISDGNGCDIVDTIVVGGPPPIVLEYLDIDDVSCNDGQTADGRVIVRASGGNNPAGLYNFNFNGALNDVGEIVSYENLGVGENYLTVSYNTITGNSCSLNDTIEIHLPPKLEIDYVNSSLVEPSCNGDCDGKIVLQAKGGNPEGYDYHWQELNSDGSVADNLCAGTYHILITDANNCEIVDSLVLEQPDELIAEIDSAASRGINCFGSESGEIQVKYSGGNVGGEYTYQWSPDVSTTSLAKNLPIGVYSVTVTDEKGCSDFATYEVKGQEPIVFVPVQQDTIKCFGDQTCISVQGVSGGSGSGYSFSVDGGLLMPIDSCIAVYGSKTPYLVSVFDKDGCREDKSILISQPDEIIVDLGGELVIELGEKGLVDLNTNTNISNVSWNIDTNLVEYEFLNIDRSELEISTIGNTTIYATVENEDGCTATGELDVKVNTVRNVRIPNIFSPDGDGLNEEFNISVGNGVEKVNYIRLYDRYGGMMFEELNPVISGGSVGSWDGTYKGQDVNTGVYVYMVEVEFLDKRKILYRGSVTLIR